uniref:DUF4457 domain-containing protein n=1 Tax=Schistosoma mansoni TaxID=6183 RepID=A0A3Q0KQ96_SCHMA
MKIIVKEMDTNYENYLNYLKQRNKQRELLQQKTEEDLMKERLEKGFQLYFNAATKYLKNKSYEHYTTNNHNKSNTNILTKKIKRKSWGDIYIPLYNNEISIIKKNHSLFQTTNTKSVVCKNLLKTSLSTYKENEDKQDNQLIFHLDIFNNWGNKKWIGLNGIEVLLNNNMNNIIKIYPHTIKIYKINHNTTHNSNNTTNNSSSNDHTNTSFIPSDNLFKSSFYTTNFQDMWLTPIHHLPLRIQFTYLLKQFQWNDIIQINIWNFLNTYLLNISVKKCLLHVIYNNKIRTLYNDYLPYINTTNNYNSSSNNNNNHCIHDSVTSIILNVNEIIPFEQFHSNHYLNGSSYINESIPNDIDHIHNNPDQLMDTTEINFNGPFPNADNDLLNNTTEYHLLSNVNEDLLLNSSLNQIHYKEMTDPYENKNKLFKQTLNSFNLFKQFDQNQISIKNNEYPLRNSNLQLNLITFNNLNENLLLNNNMGSNNDSNNNNGSINNNNSNKNIGSNNMNNNSDSNKKIGSNNGNDSNNSGINNNNSSYFICHESTKHQQQLINQSMINYPLRHSIKNFSIPELPFGHQLLFDIISTWGNLNYVGLTGIEIFLSNGMNITTLCHITSYPFNIDNLSDYTDNDNHNDSNRITNLIDGINYTCDKKHMWLIPFNLGDRHFIQITLPKWIQSSIALIRIWNYNQSLRHSLYGVKEMIIYLDKQPIFYGEINKAQGIIEDYSEIILFCTNNDILNLIGQNDTLLKLKQYNQVSMDTNERLMTCGSMPNMNE